MSSSSKEWDYIARRYSLFTNVEIILKILCQYRKAIQAAAKNGNQADIQNSQNWLKKELRRFDADYDFQKCLLSAWNLKETPTHLRASRKSNCGAVVIGEAFLNLVKYLPEHYEAQTLEIIDRSFQGFLDQKYIRLPLFLSLEENDCILIDYDKGKDRRFFTYCQDAVINIGLRVMMAEGDERYDYLLSEKERVPGREYFQEYSSSSDDSTSFNPFENARKAIVSGLNRFVDYSSNRNTMLLWSPSCRLTSRLEDELLNGLYKDNKYQVLVVGQEMDCIYYSNDYDLCLTVTEPGKYSLYIRRPYSGTGSLDFSKWYVRLYNRPTKSDLSTSHYYKSNV